jgi:adenine-specific DNA methylase
MIEQNFNIPFVANLALREKQIQQNYRPIIAVHKWFARRPGTLFRALLLSEFSETPLEKAFYSANDFEGLHVADPFMGGGTPLLEANRIGCDVTGYDINPMAFWVVKQEIEHLDLDHYREHATALRKHLEKEIGVLYRTICTKCRDTTASVKYFLWVKTIECDHCAKPIDLFPGYLLAQNRRHPNNVLVCPCCSALVEEPNIDRLGKCPECSHSLQKEGPARRGQCLCPSCGKVNRFPDPSKGAPTHRLFAIEYSCPACKGRHTGRHFKSPDSQDIARCNEAHARLEKLRPSFIPEDAIPPGDETDRLHRWGYARYAELFNSRQLLGLEIGARFIAKVTDERSRNALATNFSDLLRYQNMLCRYDAMALKSLDIFSVHGFPVGLIQCESNMLGIVNPARSMSVGSGGWSNIIDKFAKAKAYCDLPFEVRHDGKRKTFVPIHGEWIGDTGNGVHSRRARAVNLFCGDAAKSKFGKQQFDAVFTDPPYFGNVQYAELMDFCYVWLRKLAQTASTTFELPSTRNAGELTGNFNMGRTLEHFTEGLSSVFKLMARALKTGGPLAFTYHHNRIEAYHAIAVAILDAGLVCSASLPCPAEMGASIHISGTGSSIVDSVFVCRSTGSIPRRWVANDAPGIAALIEADVSALLPVYKPTHGDIRCIIFGHLTRLAIWHLRSDWQASDSMQRKLARVHTWIESVGGCPAVEQNLNGVISGDEAMYGPLFAEAALPYGKGESLVSF